MSTVLQESYESEMYPDQAENEEKKRSANEAAGVGWWRCVKTQNERT
jgi:hypothetical protein